MEEVLERKSSGSSLESGEYGPDRDTLYPENLALTSLTRGRFI
jgi:hypothetical protein